jgi:hypothetical protein
MKKSVGLIPKYITASNPKGLRRRMLQTQLKLGYGLNWFDIQYVNKKWYAFYYDNTVIDQYNIGEQLGKDTDNEN